MGAEELSSHRRFADKALGILATAFLGVAFSAVLVFILGKVIPLFGISFKIESVVWLRWTLAVALAVVGVLLFGSSLVLDLRKLASRRLKLFSRRKPSP